jgi:HSP20 family protein
MGNYILHDHGCLIYPGAYVPMIREEEVQTAIKFSNEGEKVLPPVNVTEFTDSYKIEVAMPGVKREDFLINADENILSVCAVHKQSALLEGERMNVHEFNYTFFDRHIVLPENADLEFTCAEYREGILRVYVPKTNHPAKKMHASIVVY